MSERRRYGTLRGMAAIGAVVILVSASSAAASEIQVTSSDDETTANDNCTLREAVIAANDDRVVDGCAAGNGADTIVVPGGLYLLTLPPSEMDPFGGDLDVTADVTIRGAGAEMTIIDAQRHDRVIEISAGVTAEVMGVALQNGSVGGFGGTPASGGGIENRGTLTLIDCVVRHNQVTYASVTTPGGAAGGGISSYQSLTVVRTTVSDNVVASSGGFGLTARGGGIAATSSSSRGTDALALIDSTIGGNQAVAAPGFAPLLVYSRGGGVDARNGVVINSTITANEADAGGGLAGLTGGGSFAIANATISHNGGEGLYVDASDFGPHRSIARVANTIIANNDDDCNIAIASEGHNLDSDGSCGLGAEELSATDPLLGPLADNGGPTLTRALLPGSPAIDAGSPLSAGEVGACETSDQRGVPRPQGARCDIGTFEVAAIGWSTPTPSPTATPTVGLVIDCAGDCDSGGSVSVAEVYTGVNILLGNAELRSCFILDQDGSETVTVNEVVAAINGLLYGCLG